LALENLRRAFRGGKKGKRVFMGEKGFFPQGEAAGMSTNRSQKNLPVWRRKREGGMAEGKKRMRRGGGVGPRVYN